VDTALSPRVEHLSWGLLRVEGADRPYKDAKLFPGGSREWDWRETGTSHVPGIQPADVQELIDRGATVVVLSSGMLNALRTRPETLRLLEANGVEWRVARTGEAVRLYNELRESRPVAALIHSTC
jgi:hypothetical protein